MGHTVPVKSFGAVCLQGDFLVGDSHWPVPRTSPFSSICMVKFGNALSRAPTNATFQTENWYAESLHDILNWLLFLSWDYLTSQEIILFELPNQAN